MLKYAELIAAKQSMIMARLEEISAKQDKAVHTLDYNTVSQCVADVVETIQMPSDLSSTQLKKTRLNIRSYMEALIAEKIEYDYKTQSAKVKLDSLLTSLEPQK